MIKNILEIDTKGEGSSHRVLSGQNFDAAHESVFRILSLMCQILY